MSAHKSWHEDAPKHSGEPIRPPAPFHWKRAPGIPANSALPQPSPSPADPLPNPSSESAPETDDIGARLLRAIEDTEIARRLGQPPTPIVRRAPATFRAPSTLLVRTPSAGSTPLMPSPAATPRRPAPVASSIAEQVLPIALPLPFPFPPPPAAAPEIPPALAQPTPAASPDDLSLSAPPPPSRVEELQRLTARAAQSAAQSAARTLHAATRLSTALWNWLVAVAAAAFVRMAQTGARLSLELGNWLRHTAVPVTVRAGRGTILLFIAFSNWLVHQAALARERRAQAVAQRSIARARRTAPKPAAAAAPAVRPAKQVSTRRFKSLFDPRQNPRLEQPPLVAWCWAADTPGALRIADISASGIHLLTEARWPRGATVPMTLQRTDCARQEPGSWIVADFMIRRWCKDGLAGSLIPPTPYSVACGTENCADPRTLKRFVKELAMPGRC